MPIFLPLLKTFNVDPLFFGLLVALNIQTSFLSPPVAMAPFYLKGVAPSWVNINDIFRGVMMMFILMCAQAFSLSFRGLQGEKLVQDFFEFLPGGINADIWFLMFIIFILGFFIEWIEISYIAVPLFLPIFIAAKVDMVWLATLICVNLQTSFLTPPFGWALFFLRGVAPPEITTGDIYRGIVPFVAMQLLALVICFFFPQLALWLPRTIGW